MPDIVMYSPTLRLKGEIEVAPDKSIAQRAAIIGSLAAGITTIHNFPRAADPLSTLGMMEKLGAKVTPKIPSETAVDLRIESSGYDQLEEPREVLDAGNSGTGMRLVLGLLAGHPAGHYATITGDASLRARPMKRLVQPLRELGAMIWGRQNANAAPLSLLGQKLKGGLVRIPVASAQLKSALLLSCLGGESALTVVEKEPTRNHTELMLLQFGADLMPQNNLSVTLKPSKLSPTEIHIPGDLSGAAFFLVAASLIPGSEVSIKNVGLNPTRTGIVGVLRQMGVRIEQQTNIFQGEPVGDLYVRGSALKAIQLGGEIIPNIIDEIPILSLAMSQAEGVSVIQDAAELRVKESDRLKAIATLLKALGVNVEERPDGLEIEGRAGKPFEPLEENFDPHADHRLVMTAAIANLLSAKALKIQNPEWANVSFPGFFEKLHSLIVH
ncbi:MAG: 3-phosphoshikimate 1-carboxyvinyltransferase [Candidatus Caenarcaniphilales bacterium]|nr:3-phosphoshikimate 1-carboxyvinyltransferase [Candidatus Caenarcaniphilales bacterium]